MNSMNRRGFFTRLAQITGAAVVAPVLLKSVFTSTAQAEQKRPSRPAAGDAKKEGGAAAFVDPNDPAAKAVGYVSDASKSPNSKGNHCATCGFYTKKDGDSGTCTIFQGKLVHANAFCNSWNKKA